MKLLSGHLRGLLSLSVYKTRQKGLQNIQRSKVIAFICFCLRRASVITAQQTDLAPRATAVSCQQRRTAVKIYLKKSMQKYLKVYNQL